MGYKLYLRKGFPVARPRWEVTTTLSRLDKRGRAVEIIRRVQRQVDSITRRRGAGVRFKVEAKSATYRITTVFERAGRRLGGYGFYFRVSKAKRRVWLELSTTTPTPGQSAQARVVNLTPFRVLYGAPYSFERFDGSSWSLAPESPKGAWTLEAYWAMPGQTGGCVGFYPPAEMRPGRYRLVKSASLRVTRGPEGEILYPDRRAPFILTAEFEVTP